MHGEPIPWLTYPAIFWLGSVCYGVGAVFEFGCGNSTLWWAKRSERVIGVEYDEQWLRRIAVGKSNVQIHLASLIDYPTVLAQRDDRFDVIVIDGGFDRNACVAPAIDHLMPDGLLVFDDTHLPRHAEGVGALHEAGFRRVDFVGPRPGGRFLEATSVFSRDLNRWASVDVKPVFRWAFLGTE
jgi:SAM-dependent methyltransferase